MKVLIIALIVLCGACDGSPGGAAGPTAQELAIVAEASALPVGSSLVLRAELRNAGRSPRPVQARWSVNNASIATVAQDGTLHGVTLGSVSVTAEYEQLRAEKAVTVVANVSGTWAGDARIQACGRISGTGTDPCRFLRGEVQALQLAVKQPNDRVSGEMILGAKSGTFEGVLTEDTITVKAALTRGEDQGRFQIPSWMLRFTGGELVTSGELRVDEESTNVFGPQRLVLRYSVSPLRRTP